MSQKTVYFLGAGASAASEFKLPVMKGFFKEEDFPEKGGEYPNLNEFLNTFYKSSDWGNFNLEEIITHLELTIEGFNWSIIDSYLHDAKLELTRYIGFRLDVPVLDRICNKHVKLFFRKLNPDKDSIISLNYDLIVDNIFYQCKFPNEKNDSQNISIKNILSDNDYDLDLARFEYFYKRSEHLIDHNNRKPFKDPRIRNPGIYIKLHGSIFWKYCPSYGCPNNHMFFKQMGADILCNLCGSTLETAIVPPTMKKSFEKFPKLGFLWHVAFNKLKEADRIIVIGMSFPDSDYYLKWLVRQAMIERQRKDKNLPELIIVNTDKNIFDRTKNIFGISQANTYNGLDDYLTHL